MYGRTGKSVLRNIFWLFSLSHIILNVLRKDKAFTKCGLIGGETLFYKMYILLLLLFTRTVVSICDPMNGSMPGFPVLHYLPEFAQTHVH